MLNSHAPQPAMFPNRASVSQPQNARFFRAAVELRACGVLKWPHKLGMAPEQVLVTAGLAVITNRVGKQRLIYDAR